MENRKKDKLFLRISKFSFYVCSLALLAALLVGTPVQTPTQKPALIRNRGKEKKIAPTCAEEFQQEYVYIEKILFPRCRDYIKNQTSCGQEHWLYAKALYLYGYAMQSLDRRLAKMWVEESVSVLSGCTAENPLLERALVLKKQLDKGISNKHF